MDYPSYVNSFSSRREANMHKDDEEFERFLRQFRLQEPGPLPQFVPSPRRRTTRWILAAALLVVVALPAAFIRHFLMASSPYVTVEAAGDSSYKMGEKIKAGFIIRSGTHEGAMLALEDGSHIEV